MEKSLNLLKINKRNVFFFLLSLLIVSYAQPSSAPFLCAIAAVMGYGLFWHVYRKIPTKSKAFLYSVLWFFCVELFWQSWLCSTKYQGPCMVIVYLLLSLLFALQFGLVSLFLYKTKIQLREILLVPSVWTLMEMSRIYILSGHLWNPVGLALCGSHYSMLLASFGGVYFLSFWVMLCNLCFLKMLEEKSVRFLFGCLALAPYLFGFTNEMIFKKADLADDFTVLLVQTGLYPEEKNFFSNFPNKAIRPLEQWKRIFKMLGENIEKKIDLIVLPESAMPLGAQNSYYDFENIQKIWKESFRSEFSFQDKLPFIEKKYGKWFVSNNFINQSLADHFNCEVVCGLDHRENNKSYNSAFHFEPKRLFPNRYDKQILVPIGEYLPFSFLAALAKQFGLFSFFEKGDQVKLFSETRPLSVSICLEEIYPELIRKNRLAGAEYFVNISNDGWFPNSTLNKQHFDHGILRAVENGVYLFRSCCTGITGIVDPFGRITKILESEGKVIEDGPGVLIASVPFFHYYPLYTLWGNNLVLGICFLICLLEARRVISKKGLGLA